MRIIGAARVLRSWGTTPEELRRCYAGDELVADAATTTTYGVTVEAATDTVWPWLVQMGQGRGGMYSYERLENLLGLDIHNADAIHPEWQQLAPGDQVRVVPPGRLGMRDGYAFRVELVDPPYALVLRQHPPEHPWDATWAFLVVPESDGRCRLLARSRSRRRSGGGALVARIAEWAMSPLVFVMTRKMLLGIKGRAERLSAHDSAAEGTGVA